MDVNTRTALSPKKLRSANILTCTNSCPTSPTKRSRREQSPGATRLLPSPKKSSTTTTAGSSIKSPVRSNNASIASPRTSERHSTRRRSSRESLSRPSPSRLSPFKVFTDSTVYATHIDHQIAQNKTLLTLSPPDVDRNVVGGHSDHEERGEEEEQGQPRKRVACRTLESRPRPVRLPSHDPFLAAELAFLTPPRPRLTGVGQVREEERLCKSASPTLQRSFAPRSPPYATATSTTTTTTTKSPLCTRGFTLFVDESEYVAVHDVRFALGPQDVVNKENFLPLSTPRRRVC